MTTNHVVRGSNPLECTIFCSMLHQNSGVFVVESERTGEKFDLNTFLQARDLCIAIVQEIAGLVVENMSEVDGQALVKERFSQHGITKFWHPTKFRISQDTVKSFRELPDTNLKTRFNDLYFLDVGPIIENHEADYGQTFQLNQRGFAVPTDPLIHDSQWIFQETAKAWKERHLTGLELFDFASNLAKSRGYDLNPLMAGHRLGDFPHKIYSSEKLFSFANQPTKNLWVLEIHIVHANKTRGAFFEDLLM